jgi:hypothetical protein
MFERVKLYSATRRKPPSPVPKGRTLVLTAALSTNSRPFAARAAHGARSTARSAHEELRNRRHDDQHEPGDGCRNELRGIERIHTSIAVARVRAHIGREGETGSAFRGIRLQGHGAPRGDGYGGRPVRGDRDGVAADHIRVAAGRKRGREGVGDR